MLTKENHTHTTQQNKTKTLNSHERLSPKDGLWYQGDRKRYKDRSETKKEEGKRGRNAWKWRKEILGEE